MAEQRGESAQDTKLGETLAESGRHLLSKKVGDALQVYQPTSSDAAAVVERGVEALVRLVAKESLAIGDDVLDTIKGFIAAIDQKLTAQVNEILHHEEFKKLESAWRGLDYLTRNAETDAMLKVRVFNVSKQEAHATLKSFAGMKMDQGPFFRKIYDAGFGTLQGQPFGCMVGDFYFDATGPDVEFLREMSRIAAAAHCPFISAASPKLMGENSWGPLGTIPDIGERFDGAPYAAWRSLRASEDSKYLGLTMPRFLARAPYGPESNPVTEFAFQEDVTGADHEKYTWANSAYAMAANITRAFKQYGWCSRIRGVGSGGAVKNLPVHTFRSAERGVEMKIPTEVSITMRREKELADAGLMPLCHAQGEDYAAFIGAQSVHKPAKYDKAEASASEEMSSRLPYLFAVCRFAHYLQHMLYVKIGQNKEREEIETELNEWLNRSYVLREAKNASEDDKAERPLADALVEVKENPANPGYFTSVFQLRPHFQMEGMSVALRLVSNVRRAGG